MPKWKYIDKLQTYDDRFTAFKNELDNLLARCFGEEPGHTLVTYKGSNITIKIDEGDWKFLHGEIERPYLKGPKENKTGVLK